MRGIFRIQDIPKLAFLYSARFTIPYLPPGTKHVLAETLASFTSGGEKAAVMGEELRSLFGRGTLSEEAVSDIIRETVSNFRKDLFEIWSFKRLNSRTIGDLCSPEGLEHLEKARTKGKGILIALCHFGSYKMVLPCLGHRGYPITQIAANPLEFTGDSVSFMKNKVMEIEYRAERSLPAGFIYIGSSVREIFRVLERNEILVMSLDGVVDPKRITLPFLKRKIRLSPSIAKIARKYGTPVLPVFTIRSRDDRHRVIIHDELKVDWDREDSDRQLLAQFCRLMERYVTAYPSHYAWFLYKNRTEPPGIGPMITD
ncbi:MAG: lysophospholipid acyltransferase family protein [Nitrospirales bacterium]|nr:lysophospholipid acyltransferase family protein [Nitrospirales bacterium]